ncbi:hypothetical protein CAL14_15220 [Bordetella genomosp. 9]|uniref:RHS repeat-associated core domain-containing protein n=1 Tax=Bordetella genomosp. 9 TaxID=1416803 RepID=UPI000A291758|nr:RHS repeat-associated core domain-containing protein [Bordetella genomosp. 9]ARP91467.1 hypothetical protein CAL14_15220 [Bordetella genomosp. 9]
MLMDTSSAAGFTGAYQDPVTATYPLGNGYRWYLPALMRFNARDDFSPFGSGGINPYVYCTADPVNFTDPTGHVPLGRIDEVIAKLVGDDIGQVESHAPTPSVKASADTPAHSRLDITAKEIQQRVGKKHVMVVAGFSGLGYRDQSKLDHAFLQALDEKIDQYGRENVIVVAGGTSEGIGSVYGLAKRRGVDTLGIVSAVADPETFSKDADHVIRVRPPEGAANPWEVKSANGESYMVSAALGGGREGGFGGSFYAFGGGEVARNELQEARARGVPVHIFRDFEPNPAAVAKRLINNPAFNPTPLRYFLLK